MKTFLKVLSLSAILATSFSYANESKRPERKGPPPEAYEACENKAEGEAVSIETPRGHTLEASCQLKDDVLVAVPDRHRKRDN